MARVRATQKKTKPSSETPKIRVSQTQQNRTRSTYTGTRTFDRTLHKTNTWLKEIMDSMGWDNRERALSVMRATLHALRDMLPLNEILHLGAQLPILVRGIYYDCWHYQPEPLRLKNISDFHELVRENLGQGRFRFSNEEISQATSVVIETLCRHVDGGEMRDIKGLLRKNLRDLIPDDIEPMRASQTRSKAVRVRNTPRRAAKNVALAKLNQRRRAMLKNIAENQLGNHV